MCPEHYGYALLAASRFTDYDCANYPPLQVVSGSYSCDTVHRPIIMQISMIQLSIKILPDIMELEIGVSASGEARTRDLNPMTAWAINFGWRILR
jgi:hypothetical protein